MIDRAAPSEGRRTDPDGIFEPGRSLRVDVSSGQTEVPEPADASAAPHTASTLLDMALELAARSLPVFPCGTNKRPLIKGGREFSNASTDPNRIREMWEQAGPAAKLIGVPTGGASGFDVLDVDPRHNGDAWEIENSDRLAQTRMHSTPSGGRHYLFHHADGIRNIQDGKTIAPGIDVRGQGGYVCFPPSGGYSVIHDVDIAPWPDWLLPLVRKIAKPPPAPDPASYAIPARITENRVRGFIDREVRRVRDAPVGGRHNARLTAARSIGGVAAEAGLSDTEAEEMLIAARPPEIEEEKERKTIRDGLAYGRAAPIDLNTLPDSAQFREYQQHRSNGGAPPPPQPDPRQRSVPAFMLPKPPPADIPLPEKGDVSDWLDDNGTVEDLEPLTRQAQEYRQKSPPAPDGEVQIVRGTIRPFTTIPPRQWAYGKFLLFGSAACIGGMDGAGKGLLATAMALAMITGYPLLGEKVWRTGPVAIITYEDDQDEWERRIAAVCLHYSQNGYALDYETLIGSFYFLYKPGGRVTLAERTKENGLQFPDTARIVHFLKEISAVMLIIDPFNSAHAMEDGNNNVAIAAVAQEITAIAQQAHVAALLLHHLRKGATGTVDDLMGAVALRANFRSVRILQVATEGDALGLGIPTTEAWRYLWVAGTKENYAPPPLERAWFHKASVKLNNPAGIYELGDEVGAIGRWTPPAAFEGLDYASLRAVFDALAAGPHAADKRAKAIPWAGQPLMELAGRNTEQATKILNQWLKSKTLVPGEPFETGQRHGIKTLVLDPAKVADILGPHAAAGNPQETAND